ncbi:MAG TPA: GDYXXLXY domain-containing protein [Steroidobacteraceae bacterium]|nr:GDYXXLXY domain-containing protein [Steroidobacteraceae bacterium]
MRSVLTRALALVSLLVVLVAVNGAILAKERIRANGQRIYLELAPADPRSLMQGDYMALRFAIARNLSPDASGSAALSIDASGIAVLDPQPTKNSPRIRYRVRQGQVWLGTNAYFFEEGSAARYAGARYGEFRLDRASGEAILVGLRDEDLRAL